jgi:hypothetical protein
MPARHGYRRILPAANIVLFAILLTIGYVGRPDTSVMQQGLDLARTAKSEGTEIMYVERPTPLTHLVAWSWNFPAMLFATPFGLLAKGPNADFVVNGIAAVYLVVMWYIVGLWLDHRRDRTRFTSNTPWLQRMRWTAFGISVLALFVVGVIVVMRTVLHQYAEAACTLPILFWPLFLAYAARWEIVHSRTATASAAAAG